MKPPQAVTYDVVVGAADGGGVATGLAKSDDLDGVAGQADEGIDGSGSNAEQPEKGGQKGVVVGLQRRSDSVHIRAVYQPTD